MIRSQEILGLDWGSKEIKWVRVKKMAPGRYRAQAIDILAQPSPEAKPLEILKKFVAEKQLTGKTAAVSFHDESLHIRRLELPRMPEEDLKEAIKWQMRDIVEGSTDDYAISYSTLHEEIQTEIPKLILLGFAAKKKAIENQRLLLQNIGLKPFFMEPTPVSLAFALERLYPTAEGEWIGAVDIGWSQATFFVLGEGKLHFVRQLGGISAQQIQELGADFPAKFSLSLQQALDAFTVAHKIERIDKLFLAGGGAGCPNLAGSLSKNLGLMTEIFNPLEGIEGTRSFDVAVQRPYLFGTALGLALIKA